LAKALGLSKSYLSILLRDLERQGLVYRVRVGNSLIVKLAGFRGVNTTGGRVLRVGIVWSSEYLFLGHFAKILRDRESVEVKIKTYPSALQTILALIRGEVDAVISPLVTQIYGYIVSKSLAIVGGGAKGGGYVYEIPRSYSDTITSSEMSTMDLCRLLAIRNSIVDTASTRYFSSAEEAVAMARRGVARYAVVWHPINIDIELSGGRRIASCADFDEISHCCTLAVSRVLGYEAIEKIASIYRDSIEAFAKDRERFLDWYSATVGIDVPILRKALDEYIFDPELSPKQFSRIVEALGLDVPDRSSIYGAIRF